MEEIENFPTESLERDLPADRQIAGPHPAANISCGCTGGRNWVYMVIVAGLVGLYVLASVLR